MIGSEIGESDFAIGPTPPCFTLGGNINLFFISEIVFGKRFTGAWETDKSGTLQDKNILDHNNPTTKERFSVSDISPALS